jgi:hypothetical protein
LAVIKEKALRPDTDEVFIRRSQQAVKEQIESIWQATDINNIRFTLRHWISFDS